MAMGDTIDPLAYEFLETYYDHVGESYRKDFGKICEYWNTTAGLFVRETQYALGKKPLPEEHKPLLQAFAKELTRKTTPEQRATILLECGLPCASKQHWAKSIREALLGTDASVAFVLATVNSQSSSHLMRTIENGTASDVKHILAIYAKHLNNNNGVATVENGDSEVCSDPRSLDEFLHSESSQEHTVKTLHVAFIEGNADKLGHVLDFYTAFEIPIELSSGASAKAVRDLTLPREDDQSCQMFSLLMKHGIKMDLKRFVTHLSQWGSVKLLEQVLRHASPEINRPFDRQVIDTLLRSPSEDKEERWSTFFDSWQKMECEPDRHDELGTKFLHDAINHRREDIIRDVLGEYPALTLCQGDDLGPLHHLYASDGHGEFKENARHHIMRALVMNHNLHEVAKVIENCRHEGRVSVFDLSKFDSARLDLAAYITSIRSQIPGDAHDGQGGIPLSSCPFSRIRFEKVLSLVMIPEIRRSEHRVVENEKVRASHQEVESVLDWLETQMGVNKVRKLVVHDRAKAPDVNQVIHRSVRRFGVRRLDWRALNICLKNTFQQCESGIDCSCLSTLESIWLYTNGDTNAIQQWLSEDGIKSLEKLKRLRIFIVRVSPEATTRSPRLRILTSPYDSLSNHEAVELQARLTEMLDKLGYTAAWQASEIGPKSKPRPMVNICTWNSESGKTRSRKAIPNHLPIPKMQRFVSEYKALSRKCDVQPTKVAIIDDGIMLMTEPDDSNGSYSTRETPGDMESSLSSLQRSNAPSVNGTDDPGYDIQSQLRGQVVGGWSFISRDKFSGGAAIDWILPDSSGHGTQMASLMASLDPCCELYIAQVCRDGVPWDPERAAEAVEWATMKNVDVISLSLALETTGGKDVDLLRRAIQAAANKNIVVVCATMDNGLITPSGRVTPSNLAPNVLPIVASDGYGRELPYSVDDYAYALPGNQISPGKLDFVLTQPSISGSSVATAIASGLASLVIACTRLAYKLRDTPRALENDELVPSDWRRSMVIQKFDSMKATGTSKTVVAENLFGNLCTQSGGIDAMTIVEQFRAGYSDLKES